MTTTPTTPTPTTPTGTTPTPIPTAPTGTKATSAVADPTPTAQRANLLARTALAAAGVLFALYPAVRPWTDEATMAGAEAFASSAWVAAHTMGMIAFLLLSLALILRMADGGRGRLAAALAGVGTALILPYFGAETFGLHAIGARAVADGDASLIEVTDAVRYGPVAITMFGLGLVLLAVAGALLIRDTWRAGGLTRIGGLLTGGMLALYLPQFFGTPAVRVGHGVLLAVGCVLLAVAWGRTKQTS